MAWRPHGRAEVDPSYPRAWAVCDRCGFLDNLFKLQWQFDYDGSSMPQNQNILVCDLCLDRMQPQRQPIILSPDPAPIFNARPEPYFIDETDFRTTEDDDTRTTEDGSDRVVIERLGGDGNVNED